MKLTIRKKLYGGFSAVLILLIIISAANYLLINKITNSYSELINNRSTVVSLIKDLNNAIGDEQSSVNQFLLTGNTVYLKSYQEAFDTYNATSKKASTLIKDKNSWQVLQGLDLLQEQYVISADQMISDKKKNNAAQYIKTANDQGPVIQKFNTTADKFVKMQQELLNKDIESTKIAVNSTKAFIIIITLITALLGLTIAFIISSNISKPILYLAKVATRIAAGDLTSEKIETKNDDEIGDLVKAFSKMSENLSKILKEVEISAAQVAISADELTNGSKETSSATEHVTSIIQDVANGAEKQVVSIEESVKSVSEMDREASQIACNAESVTKQVFQTSTVTKEGNLSVKQAIDQMNAIKSTVSNIAETVQELADQSNEINQIIGFITDIADQTNLLALNAAIEAARAGEAGKGFAVVAEEVRSLAEQTSTSGAQVSKVINTILQKTVKTINVVAESEKEVKDGIEAVNAAGISFNLIQNSIDEVRLTIEEVLNSSKHMSKGTDQLVSAFKTIEEISKITADGTQNVSSATEEQLATMETITQSAASLSKMSENLMNLISTFKLKE